MRKGNKGKSKKKQKMRKWMDKGGAKAERGYPSPTRGGRIQTVVRRAQHYSGPSWQLFGFCHISRFVELSGGHSVILGPSLPLVMGELAVLRPLCHWLSRGTCKQHGIRVPEATAYPGNTGYRLSNGCWCCCSLARREHQTNYSLCIWNHSQKSGGYQSAEMWVLMTP